jgi:hypothetical protein
MRLLILVSSIFLFSCQKTSEENVYTPPNTIKELKNIIYLNIDIDGALQKIPLIINQEYSQDQNIFEFKTKVKPPNISKFIDCGKMNDEIYVNYINRIFDSSLEIKTSIQLSAEGDGSTMFEVLSHYIFSSIETGTRWAFTTNTPKMILVGNPAYGAEPYRKCLSKHFIESRLMEEITLLNK